MINYSNLPNYSDFVVSKDVATKKSGFDPSFMPSGLFEHQIHIVKWACALGKAAVFCDTGLGKTRIQLVWAENVSRHTGKPVLILAPLAVAGQTILEGKTIGVNVNPCRSKDNVIPGVNIANYEMLHHFEGVTFQGVVLDESSLLKSFTGKTKRQILSMFESTPYKLACTATPSPNDHLELGNHAQFLEVMRSNEMISRFFINDTMKAGSYRLKGHARNDFWKWVATWAVSMTSPADMGFDDKGFDLPPLNVETHIVSTAGLPTVEGRLFRDTTLNATEIHKEMRLTAPIRARKVVDILNKGDGGSWLIWCNTNYEAEEIKRLIPSITEVRGSESPSAKESKLLGFAANEFDMLLTKPSIAGHGMNWQHCHQIVFTGLSYSYEQFYQAIRRCWRFGQDKPVTCHVVVADSETGIMGVIQEKEKAHREMQKEMCKAINQAKKNKELNLMKGVQQVEKQHDWTMYLGDCVEVSKSAIDSGTIDLSVYSPPFSNLYIYSDSINDMGNTKDHEEFFKQYHYLARELYRTTRDGRLTVIHCKDLPLYKNRDGAAGLYDFPGEIIRCYEAAGWTFHSRVTIWKDPVIEMQRTKNHGLLYKQLCKDSAASRQGMADYLIVMRKWGDQDKWESVTRGKERFFDYIGSSEHAPAKRELSKARDDVERERLYSIAVWQRYASPVWFDIQQTNVLNTRIARSDQDEKHICLTVGSLVLTREYGYMEIENVDPGDHVLTHRGRWMPVLAKRCNGIAETIRVCAQGVADLTVTPDHQLWARRASGARPKQSARSNSPEWVESQDTLGSYLNLKLPPEEPNKLTADEWWIIGRWLGDGHRGTRRTSGTRGAGFGEFIISCNHDESNKLIDRLGDHAGHSSVGSATQIALKGLRKEVRETLNRCGQGAGNKRLPGEAVTLCKEKSQSLLDGYLSADGHYVEKYDRHCASSISRALLLGMAMVAQRAYGVVASVYSGRPDRNGEIEGRTVKMRQDWIFAFRMSEGYRKSGWVGDDGAWKKVRKIECTDDREVWDLQVAEDASFTAEGCIVHNCPLQLDIIERAVELWSNPGDLVYSPFAGIGSEGHVSIKMGRRFVGTELKKAYFDVACSNLELARERQDDLFGG